MKTDFDGIKEKPFKEVNLCKRCYEIKNEIKKSKELLEKVEKNIEKYKKEMDCKRK